MSLWTRLQRKIGDLAGELVLDDFRGQLDQAQELLGKGEVTTAIDTLEALLAVKPDHGQAQILLGEARLANREPQRALEAFERAAKLRGGDPAVTVGIGKAHVALGNYEVAISSLARAVADAGGDRGILADAYRGLGVAWRRRGDLDKAIRELRKAVAEDSDDLDARAALGEALVIDGGPYDEALRHLERAGDSALALLGLGKLSLIEDAPAIASERLAKARALAESDPTPLGVQIRLEILIAQGDAALAQRDAMAAQRCYFEALQMTPKDGAIHARIAETHRAVGNLEAALASYERALGLGVAAVAVELDLASGAATFRVGTSRDGELGTGVAILKRAIDAAIATGDSARMLAWSNDLLALAPDDTRALVARGLAMAETQPDAARALLEIAALKDDVDAHVGLARLALPADAAKAALSALAALRVSPHHAKARELLARARELELGVPTSEDIAQLAQALEGIVAQRRELGHFVGDIARAAANLDQPLLVTVMGEFSSGKSSFVNAFIGADVAPTGITPTTATINVVRYGRERGGRIVTADGTTLELAWEPLMTHLRALTPDAARAIDRVEILVPLPQLEKINIVDTPGLNSIQPEHEATARAFIARADAVVWMFTATQGGKASEKKALRTIRDEGKRVLGVLNKADTLSASEVDEVIAFVRGELGELVETIVPVSARKALASRPRDGYVAASSEALGDLATTGNWPALLQALETRFFQQARQLKRDACARILRGVVGEAQRAIEERRQAATAAAEAARVCRDLLLASSREFAANTVLAERKELSELTTTLYRRAAREVLDLVRPRRLPFSTHSATTADRDYLIALLSSGYESAIEAGRRRVAADLVTRSHALDSTARNLATVLRIDVVGDLQRTADDQIGLALSRVFDRTRAYLRGFIEGGFVAAFFKNDVPGLELAEDAVYHALVSKAPDIDREIGDALSRAGADAVAALAQRVAHWGAVAEVQAFDLEVGIGRALEVIAARL